MFRLNRLLLNIAIGMFVLVALFVLRGAAGNDVYAADKYVSAYFSNNQSVPLNIHYVYLYGNCPNVQYDPSTIAGCYRIGDPGVMLNGSLPASNGSSYNWGSAYPVLAAGENPPYYVWWWATYQSGNQCVDPTDGIPPTENSAFYRVSIGVTCTLPDGSPPPGAFTVAGYYECSGANSGLRITSGGAPGATGYKIYWRVTPNSGDSPRSPSYYQVLTGGLPYSNYTFTPGTSFTFDVAAVNGGGQTWSSNGWFSGTAPTGCGGGGTIGVKLYASSSGVAESDTAITVTSGSTVTLRWTTSGSPDSCSIDNGIGPITTTSSQTAVYNVTTSRTYTATCTKAWAANATDSVTVNVGGGGSAPTVNLSASPTSVTSGGSSTLSWTTGNSPTSCTASGGWSGAKSTTGGSQNTGALYSTTTYYLQCSNAFGNSNLASATVTVGGGGGSCSWSPAGPLSVGSQSTVTYVSGGGSSGLDDFTGLTYITGTASTLTYRFDTAGKTWTFLIRNTSGVTVASCPISTSGGVTYQLEAQKLVNSTRTAAAGTVSSSTSPAFSCGTSCSLVYGGPYGSGTSVIVSASAASGYTFTGWSVSDGTSCSGTGTCTVTMNQFKTVSALFSSAASWTVSATGGCYDATGGKVDYTYLIPSSAGAWYIESSLANGNPINSGSVGPGATFSGTHRVPWGSYSFGNTGQIKLFSGTFPSGTLNASANFTIPSAAVCGITIPSGLSSSVAACPTPTVTFSWTGPATTSWTVDIRTDNAWGSATAFKVLNNGDVSTTNASGFVRNDGSGLAYNFTPGTYYWRMYYGVAGNWIYPPNSATPTGTSFVIPSCAPTNLRYDALPICSNTVYSVTFRWSGVSAADWGINISRPGSGTVLPIVAGLQAVTLNSPYYGTYSFDPGVTFNWSIRYQTNPTTLFTPAGPSFSVPFCAPSALSTSVAACPTPTVTFSWTGPATTSWTVDIRTDNAWGSATAFKVLNNGDVSTTNASGFVRNDGSGLAYNFTPGTYYWRMYYGVAGNWIYPPNSATPTGTSFVIPTCTDLQVTFSPAAGVFDAGTTANVTAIVANNGPAPVAAGLTGGFWLLPIGGAQDANYPNCPITPGTIPGGKSFTLPALSSGQSTPVSFSFNVGNNEGTGWLDAYVLPNCSAGGVSENNWSNNGTRPLGVGVPPAGINRYTYTVTVKSWFQTVGGDVGTSGYISNAQTPPASFYQSDFLLVGSGIDTEKVKQNPTTGFMLRNYAPPLKLMPASTYSYLAERFLAKAKLASQASFSTNVTGLNYYSGGSLALGATSVPAGRNTVWFIDGSLTINGNITVDPTSTVTLIVRDNIVVNTSVTRTDGLYIAGGNYADVTDSTNNQGAQLLVNGGVYTQTISLGRKLGGAACPFVAGGSCDNTATAAEKFVYDPKYLVQMNLLLATPDVSWSEVTP